MKDSHAIRIYRIALVVALVALLLERNGARGLAAPLPAAALPEGLSYDQAHDSGLIDWTGQANAVYYRSLFHLDNTSLPPEEGGASCASGCTESVTRIMPGGVVGGSFANDVALFEVEAAREAPSGNAIDITAEFTLSACGASQVYSLVGASVIAPGFARFSLSVPQGCRAWSLTTGGGYAHIRALNVAYVAPTATPTATFTPTASLTATTTPTTTPLPSPSATPTLAPFATPWIVTVPVVIVRQSQNYTGGGAAAGSLASYAVTPTPPGMYGIGGGLFGNGQACAQALRIFAYVDDNDDKLMSPEEGAEGLEVVVMDQSYARLGSRYTREGQAAFCLSGGQLGRTLRVDIPYLHQSRTVSVPKNLDADVEVWFRLKNPTLPLYLP